MLRAGPLSNKDLIEKLNSGFVNTSIVIPQFEKPEEFFDDPIAREWASTIHSAFTYPVDSIILSSDGEVLTEGEFRKVYRGGSYSQMIDEVEADK